MLNQEYENNIHQGCVFLYLAFVGGKLPQRNISKASRMFFTCLNESTKLQPSEELLQINFERKYCGSNV